jgi:hypothetical protein
MAEISSETEARINDEAWRQGVSAELLTGAKFTAMSVDPVANVPLTSMTRYGQI